MTTTRFLDKIRSNTFANGGDTVNLYGERPTFGWLVALPTNENIVPAELFDIGALTVYIDKYADDLAEPMTYLGTWLDDGKVYIDTSINVHGDEQAERLGREFRQLAIYNVGTGETRSL